MPCLQQRRLCRYGNADTVIIHGFGFVGSCSGQKDLHSIHKVWAPYAKESRNPVYDRDPSLAPSRSWALARTRVNFCHEVKGPLHNIRDVRANHNGWHVVCPTASTTLTIDGYVIAAYLRYQDNPDPTHKIPTYQTPQYIRLCVPNL